MKQIYYITITGRYYMDDNKLSHKTVTFSVKDTNTDLHVGDMVFWRKRLMHIEKIEYEKMDGCYR